MTHESTPLIERSILLLESLAVVFANEVACRSAAHESFDEAARRRKEALLTISVLIPKLRAASSSDGKSRPVIGAAGAGLVTNGDAGATGLVGTADAGATGLVGTAGARATGSLATEPIGPLATGGGSSACPPRSACPSCEGD